MSNKKFPHASLALVVVCVFGSAVAAPVARAEENLFVSPTAEYPYSYSSTTNNQTILSDGEISVACLKAEYSGELHSSSSELEVSAGYTGCKMLVKGVEFNATIGTGSCHYFVNEPKEGVEGSEVGKGSMTIGGSGCEDIIIESTGAACTLKIAKQKLTNDAFFIASGNETELSVESSEQSFEAIGCAGGVTHPTLHLVFFLGKWLLEFVLMKFEFTPAAINFEGAVEKEVTVKNPRSNFYLVYNSHKLPTGYGLSSVSGACFPKIYEAGESCKVLIKKTIACPGMGPYEIKGVVFKRGSAEIKP
jgi:hypothetical protein